MKRTKEWRDAFVETTAFTYADSSILVRGVRDIADDLDQALSDLAKERERAEKAEAHERELRPIADDYLKVSAEAVALRTALAESRAELEMEREARKRLASDCGAYSDRLQVIEWRAERLRVALETIVRNEELHPQWQCVGVLNVARAALAESRAREGRYKPVIDEVLRQTDVSTCPLCEVRDYDDDGTERHDDECPVPELQDALASAPASREGETSERRGNAAPSKVDVADQHSTPAGGSEGAGTIPGDDHYHEVGCCRDCPWDKPKPNRPEIPDSSDAARGRDPSGEEAANELTREAQRLGMYDAPAQASEDDAEQFCAEIVARRARDGSFYGAAALLRTRDAQAREAGRVEERSAIVAWLRETECTCESLDCPHPSIVCDRAAAIRIADAIERGDYRSGKP